MGAFSVGEILVSLFEENSKTNPPSTIRYTRLGKPKAKKIRYFAKYPEEKGLTNYPLDYI